MVALWSGSSSLSSSCLSVDGSGGEQSDVEDEIPAKPVATGGPISPGLMRLLFALTVAFALLWAGTGIAISRQRVENTQVIGLPGEQRKPDDTQVTLGMLNYAAYSGAAACLAIMGAGLIVGVHQRFRREGGTRI